MHTYANRGSSRVITIAGQLQPMATMALLAEDEGVVG